MNTYETVGDARQGRTWDSMQIIEIEHATEGTCYINSKYDLETLQRALAAKPMPEILRLVRTVVDYRAEREEEVERAISVFVSTRGWGDYASLHWIGDGELPDDEIISRIRELISISSDVDSVPSDDELRARIAEAREAKAQAKAELAQLEREEPKPVHGPGYCYSCHSYCYGDCGDYTPRPTRRTLSRGIREAAREAMFGLDD